MYVFDSDYAFHSQSVQNPFIDFLLFVVLQSFDKIFIYDYIWIYRCR